jgi:hypothetical protein
VATYADGVALRVALTAVRRTTPVGVLRRGPVRRQGADGHVGSPEDYLAQGATPTATLGVACADGQARLRRGLAAVGTSRHSCTGQTLRFYFEKQYKHICPHKYVHTLISIYFSLSPLLIDPST